MSQIKPIRTAQEYEQALSRMTELMDLDCSEQLENKDEIEMLGHEINEYEQRLFPIQSPHAIEAIKFRMEQLGLTETDLIPYIGSESEVAEVLNGTHKLSLYAYRKIGIGLGISADILEEIEDLIEDELDVRLVEERRVQAEIKIDIDNL
ncbi:DNA-binding protein [Shewanella sp. GutCb]|uniref:helix-turn-helix domain-containing protein n=1 Tax=Shewanella sp. GutCb TaxID=2058315 RepID=UPI000C7ADC6C|nr:DNA-binding protein [Shewanella sp. GutCb]PKG73107.1 DNA-binding protein [Shewanella sp. GutCb]